MGTGVNPGVAATTEGGSSDRALYLYALGPAARAPRLDTPGVDGRPVLTVCEGRWFALVHECPSRPYGSSDDHAVLRWVLQHHAVVEAAMEAAGDIIPVTFNTIVGKDGQDPYAALRAWVEASAERLAAVLARIEGCREYGVQLVRHTDRLRAALMERSDALRAIESRMKAATPALAYLLRRELEQELHEAMESDAATRADQLVVRLQPHARAVSQEKPRALELGREPGPGSDTEAEMVANLSCLVPLHQADAFLDAAGRCEEEWPGYSVRVTGPWPPYSFVSL